MSDRFEARLRSFAVELLADPPETPPFPHADVVVVVGDGVQEGLGMLDTKTRDDQVAAAPGRWLGPKVALAAFAADGRAIQPTSKRPSENQNVRGGTGNK